MALIGQLYLRCLVTTNAVGFVPQDRERVKMPDEKAAHILPDTHNIIILLFSPKGESGNRHVGE